MSIFFRDSILQRREKKCAYKEFSVRLFMFVFKTMHSHQRGGARHALEWRPLELHAAHPFHN